MNLSVIIPCYKEAQTIEQVVLSVSRVIGEDCCKLSLGAYFAFCLVLPWPSFLIVFLKAVMNLKVREQFLQDMAQIKAVNIGKFSDRLHLMMKVVKLSWACFWLYTLLGKVSLYH